MLGDAGPDLTRKEARRLFPVIELIFAERFY